ncbi:hypothetical protein [Cellulomonas fimi]|uniref:hypothetical protein n=1 Tax=Cellulomonas fimi TaxID=1708 RepID=UPI00235A071E|nr:hypothetical protein [Cellulomonas fimi]
MHLTDDGCPFAPRNEHTYAVGLIPTSVAQQVAESDFTPYDVVEIPSGGMLATRTWNDQDRTRLQMLIHPGLLRAGSTPAGYLPVVFRGFGATHTMMPTVAHAFGVERHVVPMHAATRNERGTNAFMLGLLHE